MTCKELNAARGDHGSWCPRVTGDNQNKERKLWKIDMQGKLRFVLSLNLIMTMGVFLPDKGHSQFQPGQKRVIKDGEKLTIKGVILNRDGELFLLRDLKRTDTLVALTDKTEIEGERKGLFRRDKRMDATMLVPGLILEVEGRVLGVVSWPTRLSSPKLTSRRR